MEYQNKKTEYEIEYIGADYNPVVFPIKFGCEAEAEAITNRLLDDKDIVAARFKEIITNTTNWKTK